MCLAAPLYAEHVAHRDAFDQPGSSETVTKGGEEVLVVGLDGIPIGPTYRAEYFLGADSSGRDVAVRLLYGGRNSLLIGTVAALGTILMGVVLGLLAGYFRGWTDGAISRFLDVIWSFPVILLGIALGTALALGGLKLGPITVSGDSLAIPTMIIAFVYIPYLARPIRGQVLSLREKEFVEAARAQGMGSWRIMFSEILPNVVTTLIVFFPLLVANAILLEAALSFLGAGVRPPEPSWGTMIEDGVSRIVTAPMLAVVPGAMLVLTVLSLNVFGDGVRDALDPRAKVRIEH
jgi:peptide/nickel transport system permease protein